MYNRYIPQADGSYQRSRIPDRITNQQPSHSPSPSVSSKPVEPTSPKQVCQKTPTSSRTNYRKTVPTVPSRKSDPVGIPGFLRQLLPKNFDTEDLLIVLLLLLMSGDCQEDQNTALLTLVLYLFM